MEADPVVKGEGDASLDQGSTGQTPRPCGRQYNMFSLSLSLSGGWDIGLGGDCT